MIKKLQYSILLFFVLSVVIINAQPVNDFQCNPRILTVQGAPPCSPLLPANNYGPVTSLNSQTTIGATNDSLSGIITTCYSSLISPKDVWYAFVARESHVEIVVHGSGGIPLKDLYVGIYESLSNDCVGLIPRNCHSSSGVALDTIDFAALAIGVKYYVQIASSSVTGNGSFNLFVRSKNSCSDCMKTSVLQAFPPPMKASYAPDTTVGFCYSVIGYNEQYGNRLHGIVPLFGSGWDSPTFNVIQVANSSDSLGQWKWFSNININGSNESGFFYDVGNDNDPTNNLGDHAGTPHVWTFCFTLKTQSQSFCNTLSNDLSIRFINYSDGESGSLVSTQNCSGDEDYVIDAHMNCCEKPQFTYSTAASCNTVANGTVTAHGAGSTLGYIYDLYNSGGTLLNTNSGFANYSYNNLTPGNYYLNVTNNSANCKTSVGFKVEGPVNYILSQTVFGCGGSCSNQAKFTLLGGAPPQSITWQNGDTGPVTTSGLCGGKIAVTIKDNTGTCTIVDTLFITPLPPPSVEFQYDKTYYCTSDSTAILTDYPNTGGGSFNLAFSTSSGITASEVNPSTGEVNLLNVTAAGYAVIKYQTNPPCIVTAVDTIYFDKSLAPVSLSTYQDRKFCYGNANPIFFNTQTLNKITWYDEFGFNIGDQLPGTSFDPFLGSTPLPGSYPFYITQSGSTSAGCESVSKQIIMDVYNPPIVTAGENVSTCPGFGTTLHASGADSYTWRPANFIDDPTAPDPVASPLHTTLYYLVGKNSISGCSASDSVFVYIDSVSDCGLIIYHGFTPNNDGHNDSWLIDGISNDSKNKVAVFNRWGRKIWDVSNYDNLNTKWEGQDFKGEIVPDGTYFYLINYKGEQLKGWVELTR